MACSGLPTPVCSFNSRFTRCSASNETDMAEMVVCFKVRTLFCESLMRIVFSTQTTQSREQEFSECMYIFSYLQMTNNSSYSTKNFRAALKFLYVEAKMLRNVVTMSKGFLMKKTTATRMDNFSKPLKWGSKSVLFKGQPDKYNIFSNPRHQANLF